MVLATKSGFRSWSCKGKVLAPFISVVLNRNHLIVLHVYVCRYLNVICYQVIEKILEKKM